MTYRTRTSQHYLTFKEDRTMQNEDYHNQDQSNILKLTEKQFRKLDILVRKKAGDVLELYRHESRDDFAYMSMMAGDVVIDTNKMDAQYTMTEKGIINLINQIDIERLKATNRPEMDWAKLPTNKIYEFIVLHEIAHTKQNSIDIAFKLRNPKGRRLAMEVNADRQAWKWLFPDTTFPIKKDLTGDNKKVIKKVLIEFEEYLCFDESLEDKEKRLQLPIDPNRYMPLSHYKHGIPFVDNNLPPFPADEEQKLLDIENSAHLLNDLLDMDWSKPVKQFNEAGEWKKGKNKYYFWVGSENKTEKGTIHNQHTPLLPSPRMALDFVNTNHNSINSKLYIQYGISL